MPDKTAWDALSEAQREVLAARLMQFTSDMIDITVESHGRPIELTDFRAFVAVKAFVAGLESDGLVVRGPDA
jgi:hypothetical protein